jgi:hypothetical protein
VSFNPIRGDRGEFRVCLNVSELGDPLRGGSAERAWDILAVSQSLGFEKPQFRTHLRHSGAVEVCWRESDGLSPASAQLRLSAAQATLPLSPVRSCWGVST